MLFPDACWEQVQWLQWYRESSCVLPERSNKSCEIRKYLPVEDWEERCWLGREEAKRCVVVWMTVNSEEEAKTGFRGERERIEITHTHTQLSQSTSSFLLLLLIITSTSSFHCFSTSCSVAHVFLLFLPFFRSSSNSCSECEARGILLLASSAPFFALSLLSSVWWPLLCGPSFSHPCIKSYSL